MTVQSLLPQDSPSLIVQVDGPAECDVVIGIVDVDRHARDSVGPALDLD